MRDESLNFLKKLVNTPSPTGHESRGQRVWLDYVDSSPTTPSPMPMVIVSPS